MYRYNHDICLKILGTIDWKLVQIDHIHTGFKDTYHSKIPTRFNLFCVIENNECSLTDLNMEGNAESMQNANGF